MHFSLVTCLTPNRIKTNVFERDENYVAALRDIRQRWTSTQMLCNMLWNTASLILRPDAVAGGQAANILPALRDLGFVPIAARSVRLSLDQTRELWRYQANVSTRERLRLLDLIMTSAPSLYILFRDATERVSAPATVHLTYLKGTAIVENRRKWHLRTMAGPKVANIVSYVHVSDDPADMVREIALLFPRRQWLDLMNEAEQATDRTEKVRSLLAALQADGPKDLLYRDNARSLPSENRLHTRVWNRILNTSGLTLFEAETRHRWRYIVERSKRCKVFVDGNSYDGRSATVPDDKELSLPLDGHLILREVGPR
jgi:nucleoside diphosphate kinase